MIFTSTKVDDIAFVIRVIREQQLDPRPIAGYEREPDYWCENDRWRRIVERYQWGAVVLLSNREKDEHATIVIVGELDVATGKIKTKNGAHGLAPAFPWYRDLSAEFSTEPKAQIDVPSCLGYREADHTCDGGLNDKKQLERACAWREHCMALQDEAARRNKLPENVIDGMDGAKIVQLTRRLMEKPDGKRVQKPVRPTPEAYEVFNGLWKALAEMMAPRRFVSRREEAGVGDIFAIDRVDSSGYIRIYCQVESGRPILLTGIRLKAHGGVDLQLPLDPKSALLKDIEAHVVSWRDGGFLSALKRVPTRVSLEKACDVICAMVAHGLVRLPSPGGAPDIDPADHACGCDGNPPQPDCSACAEAAS